MSDFEDIVEASLDDVNYVEVEAPVAHNASISAGYIQSHGDECSCEGKLLVISFKLEGSDYPLELAVLPESNLGAAILSGEFQSLCQTRLDSIDN